MTRVCASILASVLFSPARLATFVLLLTGACATEDNPAYMANVSDAGLPSDLPAPVDLGRDVPQSDAGADSGDPGPAQPPPDAVVAEVTAPIDAADAGRPAAGLVLHWRLDELTGVLAADSSSSRLDGTFTGSPVPAPTPDGAPTYFANPGSRLFRSAVNHSVQLGRSAPALQPAAGVTVSVWFRTTLTGRADLLGHGSDYFLRIMSGEIEFVRRRPTGSSADIYITASGLAPTATDGQWHHAAGVASTGSIAMYLDGALIARKDEAVPFTYLARDFTVGRAASAGLSFEGSLDDVRIYNRALAEAEIRALAAGAP